MKTHYKLDLRVNVEPLKAALYRNMNLWDKYNLRRTAPGSPHVEMQDIWIRYNDINKFSDGDYSAFADEHDSVWYPAAYQLPVLPIIFQVFAKTLGERLGGVLITKLPPGGKIVKHVDSGWHAEYYDKFYIPIKNEFGATFSFEDGIIEPEEGEVYYFENDKPHWVNNNSTVDRIAMIICIRRTL